MKHTHAEILREYGPFPDVDAVHGVSFDGQLVWFASGDRLNALDPESGQIVGTVDVAAHAGTAFDGTHLFQIAEAVIRKIDPRTGEVLGTIPAPGNGGDSGLAWADGTLWVGQHRDRKIHQVDPDTGAVLRTIESDRFVMVSPGSTASSGTALGRTRRAMSGASIPRRERCSSASKCRPEPVSRDLNRIGATDFSVAAETAER